MNINVMEWNIHQQGGMGKTMPLWILEEITQETQVLVLTEYNCNATNIDDFDKALRGLGFESFTTDYSFRYANDTLIAVRGEEIKVMSTSFVPAYPDAQHTNQSINFDRIPENLRVDISVDGKTLTILGIRIKDLKGDYSTRCIEMKNLVQWVSEISNPVIIAGDFNNLRVNTPVEDWNLDVLDNLLGHTLVRVTPANHSWGLAYTNGKFDGYIKNDHIICSKTIACVVSDYDWNFVSKRDYPLSDMNDFGSQKVNTPFGYPDHGILRAKIKV